MLHCPFKLRRREVAGKNSLLLREASARGCRNGVHSILLPCVQLLQRLDTIHAIVCSDAYACDRTVLKRHLAEPDSGPFSMSKILVARNFHVPGSEG